MKISASALPIDGRKARCNHITFCYLICHNPQRRIYHITTFHLTQIKVILSTHFIENKMLHILNSLLKMADLGPGI
jgi:hypothetical protein